VFVSTKNARAIEIVIDAIFLKNKRFIRDKWLVLFVTNEIQEVG